jgi:CheY-like chemotaxis protein
MPPARVLLVDTDSFFTRRARRLLEDRVDLHVAGNRWEALSAARTWMPDVVVLDMLLNDGDSFLLVDELRKQTAEDRRQLAVIYLSRGPGSATRCQADAGGFLGVVTRDAGPDCLCSVVQMALGVPEH